MLVLVIYSRAYFGPRSVHPKCGHSIFERIPRRASARLVKMRWRSVHLSSSTERMWFGVCNGDRQTYIWKQHSPAAADALPRGGTWLRRHTSDEEVKREKRKRGRIFSTWRPPAAADAAEKSAAWMHERENKNYGFITISFFLLRACVLRSPRRDSEKSLRRADIFICKAAAMMTILYSLHIGRRCQECLLCVWERGSWKAIACVEEANCDCRPRGCVKIQRITHLHGAKNCCLASTPMHWTRWLMA